MFPQGPGQGGQPPPFRYPGPPGMFPPAQGPGPRLGPPRGPHTGLPPRAGPPQDHRGSFLLPQQGPFGGPRPGAPWGQPPGIHTGPPAGRPILRPPQFSPSQPRPDFGAPHPGFPPPRGPVHQHRPPMRGPPPNQGPMLRGPSTNQGAGFRLPPPNQGPPLRGPPPNQGPLLRGPPPNQGPPLKRPPANQGPPYRGPPPNEGPRMRSPHPPQQRQPSPFSFPASPFSETSPRGSSQPVTPPTSVPRPIPPAKGWGGGDTGATAWGTPPKGGASWEGLSKSWGDDEKTERSEELWDVDKSGPSKAPVDWGESGPSKVSWGVEEPGPSKPALGTDQPGPNKASWGMEEPGPSKASWGMEESGPSKASWEMDKPSSTWGSETSRSSGRWDEGGWGSVKGGEKSSQPGRKRISSVASDERRQSERGEKRRRDYKDDDWGQWDPGSVDVPTPTATTKEGSSDRDRERRPSTSKGWGDSHPKESSRRKEHSRSPPSHSSSVKCRHSRSSSPAPKRSRWEHIDKEVVKEKEKPIWEWLSGGSEQDKGEDDKTKNPPWVRCSPGDTYYDNSASQQCNGSSVVATDKLKALYKQFEEVLGLRQTGAMDAKPPREDAPEPEPPPEDSESEESTSSSSSEESETEDTENDEEEAENIMEELRKKKAHPDRLHEELWYNDPGEMNDGPLCRCSLKSRRTGIRHNIYPGEELIPKCDPYTNNANRLHHYRITMSPFTNFLTDRPTVIQYDDHEYIFEGFSMLSHHKLQNIPDCKLIRFNIEYTIHLIEEKMPENFCVHGLDMFSDFLFNDILELVDWDRWGPSRGDGKKKGCSRFHFMPRFVRNLPENGKEVLAMHQVLQYLQRSNRPLVEASELALLLQLEEYEWQRFAEQTKNMIVTHPGMKPCSVRVDQLDREQLNPDVISYPVIVHFGIRPAQLSYAGDPKYQKLWKSYLRLRHLLANSPKVRPQDRQKLFIRETELQKIRSKSEMRREVTVELSSEGFVRTGIRSDVCQHALLLPVLMHYLRYHACLNELDQLLGSKFEDRSLLELALTHPSHHLNFGMNPDHARNSLSNCGMRQPKYGDRRIHHVHTRKKGINTLINIMSRMGHDEETPSLINHNERLEFLGDAVVEFLTSSHLYFMFPDLEEGGLATYRTAIVQNQHLAVLAKKLRLDEFMLYAHGPDLCRESDLRHAMANCLEALIGAMYMQQGLEETKKLFCRLLFSDEDLQDIWLNHPTHPLQQQEPEGDRHLIESSPVLKRLTEFESRCGMEFKHVRLLARAFTHRTVGFNNLTLGHNQRLEFLGDSVMQMVSSEYLYKHFPDHHEGHLSLLRSSLVNNRTQALVSQDLGMEEYIISSDKARQGKLSLRQKTLADLMEAFMGALYVDQGLEYVCVFMNVCFFPRLREFIMNQEWNDPKSQLQQCCLTLRTEGKEPDIPFYKILDKAGPSHARKYTVAVYFKGERIGTGVGSSIQQAEMAAARDALKNYKFPQLAHQRRFMDKKYKHLRRILDIEEERSGRRKEGGRDKERRKDRRREPKKKGRRPERGTSLQT
ncbi:ribonuclease 3-like isoform X1 [Branchiostoma lanceolatum]|uniref:ribonuclease 3-like isoform X1 n=1 Tax=Branchiostoma lanceolatum TaxID=7740 RepID=UPI00345685C1